MVLKPGMNTSDVSDKWTLPTSNVNNITAVDPPGVSSSYRFPVGNTIVKWVAVNEIGEQAYCVVHVNVYGKYASSYICSLLLMLMLLLLLLSSIVVVVIK